MKRLYTRLGCYFTLNRSESKDCSAWQQRTTSPTTETDIWISTLPDYVRSFLFLPDWNGEDTSPLLISPMNQLKSLIVADWDLCAHTLGYKCACLCGCVISVALQERGVCTWPVFSRQLTGLWWLSLLHLCFGDMRGGRKKPQERERETGDGEKWRKCPCRKTNGLRDKQKCFRGGWGDWLWRGGCRKSNTQKRERTEGLCVCAGLFLWGRVCVFQLWTVDYAKIQENAGLSVSLYQPFQCLSAVADCKLLFMWGGGKNDISGFQWQHCWSRPAEADRPAEAVWVYTSQEKTDTLQQEAADWDLAVIMLLHPSCSLCSSNPLPCPSAWQSYTHGMASHSAITHTHMYVHQEINAQHARGGAGLSLTEWKKQSQQMSKQLNTSICCHNCFCHYVVCTPSTPPHPPYQA